MQAVRLPRLGQTMEAGALTLWYLDEGDTFREGDPLYEVETEKSNADVEAKQDGVLLRILAQPGAGELPVGTVLAVIGDLNQSVPDHDIEVFLAGLNHGAGADTADAEPATPPDDAPTDVAKDEPQQQVIPGAVVKEEAKQEVVANVVIKDEAQEQVGPNGVLKDEYRQQVLAASSEQPGRVHAVPKARQVARQLGVDLQEVAGSGDRGVIRVNDVLRTAPLRPPAQLPAPSPTPTHAGAPASAVAAPGPLVPPGGTPVFEPGDDRPAVRARLPLNGVHRAMAQTMARTWTEVPQFVQQMSVDATALVARLKRVRFEGTPATYTDLLVGAVAAAAAEVSEVNSSLLGEEIVQYADVNVSVAVATDRGLYVPAVRRAQFLSLSEITTATKALAEKARAGNLTRADLSGGTITLSNLGAFGVDTGFPILNAPQCALVFAGTLGDQPVVIDGRVCVQARLNLAIAFDHRVVDGMAAARFSAALRARVEAGG